MTSAHETLVDGPVDPGRSALMKRVKRKDTAPELVVRRLLHALGYRYRLHAKDLPGRPDIVFRSRRKVILVHGCFWHRHDGCLKSSTPKQRRGFWTQKFRNNRERDRRNQTKLEAAGWRCWIIWECETRFQEELETRVLEFLGRPGPAE